MLGFFNRKEFPEACLGVSDEIVIPNQVRNLNIKFRFLTPEGQNETSEIPLWLALGIVRFKGFFIK